MNQPPLESYWSLDANELRARLNSSVDGLSSINARQRLEQFGPNTLELAKRFSLLGLFLTQFKSPLVLILLFAASISVFVQEWTDAAVIFVIVFGSAIITFAQEYMATNAVAKLSARLVHRMTVLRDGRAQEIPVAQLVPGDVVLLSAGSLIPADARVLQAKDFFVNQAVLTGETFPVEKNSETISASALLGERTNSVFMGTSVRNGFARAIVVKTGAATEYGQIAQHLTQRAPETEFERGIRQFGVLLSQVMVVLVLVVFTINVISAKPPLDSLLFAIALAVGISPELLPAIITINLSQGARAMAKHGVIVRRLNAIENFGSMDVLCTDKTGTLTEGNVVLDRVLDAQGNISEQVFRYAYWNAFFQSGLANPLDDAIKIKQTLDASHISKIDEVPYDFVRKRLSIVVQENGQIPLLITKGALDNVLAVCTEARAGALNVPLNTEIRTRIDEQYTQWSAQGFRVLGVAVKEVHGQTRFSHADEREMVFAGLLLFFDPPKPDAAQAIAALANLGVQLKIITGDNRRVAHHFAEKVGINTNTILTGAELNVMSDEALWHHVEQTTLFSEVDPNQKERIIRALQKRGHVVGYMGDGINDAPALHDADVSISVQGAVDVAREAADFVLLQQDLDVLRRGIQEGRVTFANSLKYIFITTSANFGNMLSMAGASLFLPFLPLLAKQILLNNFLSDFPALAIATDNVDPEWINTPHRWNITFIRNFMIVFGLVSSVFDFATFGTLLFILNATPEIFRTGWFIESLLTELLVALIVRTRRPFFASRPGRWLLRSTILIIGVTLALPYLPFAPLLGFVPLPLPAMALILTITLLYVVATELAKKFFYARVGTTF